MPQDKSEEMQIPKIIIYVVPTTICLECMNIYPEQICMHMRLIVIKAEKKYVYIYKVKHI